MMDDVVEGFFCLSLEIFFHGFPVRQRKKGVGLFWLGCRWCQSLGRQGLGIGKLRCGHEALFTNQLWCFFFFQKPNTPWRQIIGGKYRLHHLDWAQLVGLRVLLEAFGKLILSSFLLLIPEILKWR